MGMEIWFLYVSTVFILMSTPGPSQLLMLSNSIASGFQKSLFTAAGDLSANFLQMIVASIGLVSIVQQSSDFFVVVKWAGVAYLSYLGLRLIFSKKANSANLASQVRSSRSLYWQGFVTSAANPKAVIFFAALFPQFINPTEPLLSQFAILSATYLIMDAMFLFSYGKSAAWISAKLKSSARQHLGKISGSFLIGAAVLLGLKEVDTSL
ncbi:MULTISPECIES: LysE family translocator [unclassified Halomonas]|uniref:LysE family translocator n=1 Tax=unclassified Halomonas TaxID=2609666 RepID=UPI0007D9F3A6|nr:MULTISPECIES: LysE family translocator [unclassified Halomonas]MBT2788522.1 LysE family translocator [Halomonas sp. ISL-106]MBT2798113.1 LysE family translocator [Halomonas sp. ISL-104]OAL60670.1 lysine transporter LysE [Halomonas sp. ALS9]